MSCWYLDCFTEIETEGLFPVASYLSSDICGDLEDLKDSPLLTAEEVDNLDHPDLENQYESFTWTFYRFGTEKGTVTVRWLGISNGYYGEGVSYSEE